MSGRLGGLALLAWLPAAPYAELQTPDPVVILTAMRGAYDRVRDYRMRLHKEERIKSERNGRPQFALVSEDAVVRFRKRGDLAPGSYRRDIYFDSGCTFGCPAVYREGLNGGLISVQRGPDVAPRAPLAMRNQHHPITSLDLGHTIALVLDNVTRGLKAGVATVRYDGRTPVNGRDGHAISVVLDWRTRPYAVSRGQTLWAVADASGRDMYVILYNNDAVFRPDDPLTVDTLVLPEYYARRLAIWVDATHGLPLKLEVYDASDVLYERYVYADLTIDTGLSDADFR